MAQMLDGILDRLLIDASGLEGIKFTCWIQGNSHFFEAPIVPKEGRSKMVEILNKALGTRVTIITDPPTGIVFQSDFGTFQLR